MWLKPILDSSTRYSARDVSFGTTFMATGLTIVGGSERRVTRWSSLAGVLLWMEA